ncbi:DUF2199 domain-containing protein [Edaphobacter albus]|uniref:DUF2199 domain-containing protein n=1 Tax=Edaphobacter sp. 4G125 TaxID=2763071 RepID=UPI001648FE5C|nr:DUF2199 domain-containing protein [Edaphobacter sp. 4G125]QNI36428.1 DUF2199 domain-containing protein [Edaphobacter sp. 4G125]
MSTDLHTGFACTVCGQRHELPLQYSVNAPQAVLAVPPEERDRRIVMTPDQCVIDGKDFYLRGRILLPILDSAEPFVWGVWAEVSPKSFLRANELWNTPGRENEPSFPGWLNSDIFLFGSTLNLEVNIHTQPVGERPQFTISDPNHPLAIEQRNGITLERAEEIAEMILHHGEPD